MRIKYGIGLFVISFVILYFVSFSIYGSYKNEDDKTNAEETISADGHALKSDCFYLYEVNGYVVVYQGDKKTPYEYTDIMYSELPELLRQEIKNGKYIENVEELYGFLENYSS